MHFKGFLSRYYNFLIVSLILILTSCQKGELPVPKHDSGNVITTTVDMDASYKWQIYFDLKTNTVVGKNLKTSWDLGFETTENGFHVILNSSKFMFVWNTMETELNLVTDTLGFYSNRKCDVTSGNIDSTAIGDWTNLENVFIVDRGYNEIGLHLGYRKIKILSVTENQYKVRVASIDGTNDTTIIIPKNTTYNFSFLSFDNYLQPIVEPPKATWDLVFTQYIHIFHNPYEPYLVTGCLINRNSTFAVTDSTKNFADINFEHTASYNYSEKLNTIGYSWKVFNGNNFTTDPSINYVIKDVTLPYFGQVVNIQIPI